MAQLLTFIVPLPPPVLRANNRAHWGTRRAAANEYSLEVYTAAIHQAAPYLPRTPYKEADVHYEWRYAKTAPDHSNLGGNTKYLQDILCMAPINMPPTYKRWHLGLVEDDRGITASYDAVKVPTVEEECVVVTMSFKNTSG